MIGMNEYLERPVISLIFSMLLSLSCTSASIAQETEELFDAPVVEIPVDAIASKFSVKFEYNEEQGGYQVFDLTSNLVTSYNTDGIDPTQGGVWALITTNVWGSVVGPNQNPIWGIIGTATWGVNLGSSIWGTSLSSGVWGTVGSGVWDDPDDPDDPDKKKDCTLVIVENERMVDDPGEDLVSCTGRLVRTDRKDGRSLYKLHIALEGFFSGDVSAWSSLGTTETVEVVFPGPGLSEGGASKISQFDVNVPIKIE